MYAHEVASLGTLTSMAHFRETALPSGLITVETIGHTVALREDSQESKGIKTAGIFDIRIVNESRTDEADSTSLTPVERITCDNLADFVQQGVAKWGTIVKNLGSVIDIEVRPTEIREIVEETSATGIVLVNEEPETVFKGFRATPDEITAMENIAYAAKTVAADDQPSYGAGLYL